MNIRMNLISYSHIILLFVIGLIAPSYGLAQPSFSKTMQFWNSQEFIDKFMASYGVKSEVEPKISTEEKQLFDKLILEVKQSPERAILTLSGKISSESSAALDFTLGNLYAQANDYPKAVFSIVLQ